MNKKQIRASHTFKKKVEIIWDRMSHKGKERVINAFEYNRFNQENPETCLIGLGCPEKIPKHFEWSHPTDAILYARQVSKSKRIYFEVFQAVDLRKAFIKSHEAFLVANSIIHEFVSRKWYNGDKR